MNETLVRSENKICGGTQQSHRAPRAAGLRRHRVSAVESQVWTFRKITHCRSTLMNNATLPSEGYLHRKARDMNRSGHKLLLLINAILALVALSAKAAGY